VAVVDARIEERARQAAQILARHARVVRAYLFGSHVSGQPDRWSDIDIAVFVKGFENWSFAREVKVSAVVQEAVGNDIEPHYFSAKSLENPEPASFAAYVIRHGVPIPLDPK